MSEKGQNEVLEEKENLIILTVKIEQNDLYKDIYFLDNTNYIDLNGEEHLHDNLKELNNTNVDLYINNIKHDFKKYFTPDEEGEYSIKLEFKNNIKDCSFMFAGCMNIIDIDFKSFITEDAIDMKYMFSGCIKLKHLNLYSFNTKKVTNMAGMFGEFNDTFFCIDKFNNLDVDNFLPIKNSFELRLPGCIYLTDINISSFDTSNVKNMSFMFGGCSNLVNLNLLQFNTKNVTNMMGMFNSCTSLLKLDLSSFNTENVINMMSMFTKCLQIEELDLSSFNTSKVTNMIGLFGHNIKLKNVNLSSFNTQNVNNMMGMFNSCESLQNLNISNFDTNKVTCVANMFINCKNLSNLDLSNFNIPNIEPKNCQNMFKGCTHYKTFHLSHFAAIDESILLGYENNN